MLQRICAVAAAMPVLLLATSAANASLMDGNTMVAIDHTTSAGMHTWKVDGVDHLATQWFWYRVGTTGPEASIDTLTLSAFSETDTNADTFNDTAFIRYSGTGFTIEVKFTLTGGSPGSGTSDIAEQIKVTNTGTTALDFHFFQYSDFDLNNTSTGDVIAFTNTQTARQTESGLVISETVVTPIPARREATLDGSTLAKLNDGVATTLSNTPAVGVPIGPGDAVWAFQWDFALAAGSSFLISKDKQIVAVPEPGSMALCAFGSLGLVGYGVRRRKSRAAA